jgi:hypothetical protein
MENCCQEKPNYGIPLCGVTEAGVVVRPILVPLRKSTGELNTYALSTLDSVVLNGLLYNSDATQRWYPLPRIENFAYTIADSQIETASNGKKSFLREGVITIAGEMWDEYGNAVLKGKLAKVRCSEWGVIFVSNTNNIIGRTYTEGGVQYFAPIQIDAQSFDPKHMFQTDSTTVKNMLTFDLDRTFDDSTYYAISGNEIWDGTAEAVTMIDFVTPPRIIDCNYVISSISQTGFVAVINDDFRQGQKFAGYDDAGNVVGLVKADFLLTNVTDDTTITITSTTEAPDGTYTFVIPSQTVADKLELSIVIDNTKVVNYNGKTQFLVA